MVGAERCPLVCPWRVLKMSEFILKMSTARCFVKHRSTFVLVCVLCYAVVMLSREKKGI